MQVLSKQTFNETNNFLDKKIFLQFCYLKVCDVIPDEHTLIKQETTTYNYIYSSRQSTFKAKLPFSLIRFTFNYNF